MVDGEVKNLVLQSLLIMVDGEDMGDKSQHQEGEVGEAWVILGGV
jgi:hypothetical protein